MPDIIMTKPQLNPLIFDAKLPSCVIFDIDGTLAAMYDRSPYDVMSVVQDKPNGSIIWLQKTIARDLKTVMFLMSGRSEISREITIKWLDDHKILYDKLFMRKKDDDRRDDVIKKELFEENIMGKYNVIFVIDDRDRIVKMWRDLGITCLQCQYGDF